MKKNVYPPSVSKPSRSGMSQTGCPPDSTHTCQSRICPSKLDGGVGNTLVASTTNAGTMRRLNLYSRRPRPPANCAESSPITRRREECIQRLRCLLTAHRQLRELTSPQNESPDYPHIFNNTTRNQRFQDPLHDAHMPICRSRCGIPAITVTPNNKCLLPLQLYALKICLPSSQGGPL